MGAYRAADPAGQARRRQTAPYPRGDQRRDVHSKSTGCQWRALPKDLPPRSTVHDYLALWNWDRHAGSHPSCALPQVPRESRARSQPHGLHHRHRVPLKKQSTATLRCRQADRARSLVDTQGLLLHGNRRRRSGYGGLALLATLFGLFPFLGKLFADSAYQGPVFHSSRRLLWTPHRHHRKEKKDQKTDHPKPPLEPSLPIRLSPTPTICSVSPWTAGKGRRRRIEEAIRLILDCSENRTGV